MKPMFLSALAGLMLLLMPPTASGSDYAELSQLFTQWRTFESPPLHEGAPDYRAETNRRRHALLKNFQRQLDDLEIAGWPVHQQIDWHLVRAEMNGMDFNIRVLRPWERDPAFYTSVWTFQSDTPAHEGPNHHAIIDLWTYEFPLDAEAESSLTAELRGIPPLLRQARANLIGNARELWIGGIKNLRDQAASLRELTDTTVNSGDELRAAVIDAIQATDEFIVWLEAEGATKTGPSGIGIEAYNWQRRNVHLIPMTWTDEVRLLERELDRALSSLKLEEHRNRNLPPLVPISTAEEFERVAASSVKRLTRFLREGAVLPPYDYIEPVLEAHVGQFVAPEARNFFATVAHHDPLALWTHWYHWFDLAHMQAFPNASPIRRGPLLYNIWDSRSEGLSTGFEEMTMAAGLFDDNPRARELVWVMLAQRAARGLGSLYAQANQYTLKEARDFHVAWTPRGWMREDLDLLGFEQLLYLRQPGYGTSYVTGKIMMDQLLAERGRQRGNDFTLEAFFAEVDSVGVIPVSMIRWQLTGYADEIQWLWSPAKAQTHDNVMH